MNSYTIDGKNYERVTRHKNIGIAEAVHFGLVSKGYDAVLFEDSGYYRVVVKEEKTK